LRELFVASLIRLYARLSGRGFDIIAACGGFDITSEQKQENQKKARKRIAVERLIRLVKIFRVAAERFR
jgi:hypothetical protein